MVFFMNYDLGYLFKNRGGGGGGESILNGGRIGQRSIDHATRAAPEKF